MQVELLLVRRNLEARWLEPMLQGELLLVRGNLAAGTLTLAGRMASAAAWQPPNAAQHKVSCRVRHLTGELNLKCCTLIAYVKAGHSSDLVMHHDALAAACTVSSIWRGSLRAAYMHASPH